MLKRLLRISVATTLTLALWIAFLMALAVITGPVAPAPSGAAADDCAQELAALTGEGEQGPDAFRITALDATGSAFVLCRLTPVEASDFPVLRVEADGFPPNYVLMLAWRIEGGDEARFVRVQVPRGRLQTYYLGNEEGWAGRLTELALYLYPQEPAGTQWSLSEPIEVRRLALESDSLLARINAMGTSWFGVDPWNHRALNTLGEHHGQLTYYRLNHALFALWLIAVPIFGIALARGFQRWAIVGAVVALPAALIAYGHWLDSLAWQRKATEQIFGDLAPEQRQLRQYDGDLVQLAQKTKKLAGELSDPRVFVSAADAVTAIRGAYHLRPLNVIPSVPGSGVRSGDLILIYRQPDRADDAARGVYRRGRIGYAVRPLFQTDAGVLVRVEQ